MLRAAQHEMVFDQRGDGRGVLLPPDGADEAFASITCKPTRAINAKPDAPLIPTRLHARSTESITRASGRSPGTLQAMAETVKPTTIANEEAALSL